MALPDPDYTYRIAKETASLVSDPLPGVECKADETNTRRFHVTMAGPKGSPYEGTKFDLEMVLPDRYPMVPPKVR